MQRAFGTTMSLFSGPSALGLGVVAGVLGREAEREEGASYSVPGYLVSKNTAVPPVP